MQHQKRFTFLFVCSMAVAAVDTGCSGDAQSFDENAGQSEPEIGQVQAAVDTVINILPPNMTSQAQKQHSMSYFQCAAENDICHLNQFGTVSPRYVAFGPTGGGLTTSYKFQLMTGSFGCIANKFGAPATSSVPRTCYVSPFTYAPNQSGAPTKEHDFTSNDTNGIVAYGANGVFNFQEISHVIGCNNADFVSDPIPGVNKACYIIDQYTVTGAEHSVLQAFALPVAYCGNGRCNYKVVSGVNLPCDNNTFGDPNPGITKYCYEFRLPTFLAAEPNSYNTGAFGGSTEVAYGSGTNGVWLESTSVAGNCTNDFFAGDPDVAVSKFCYTF